MNLFFFSILLSPLLFGLSSVLSWFQTGNKPKWVKYSSLFAALYGIKLSIVLTYVLFTQGAQQTALLGIQGVGLGLRIDSVSVVMFWMITILSFIILRYSYNYMDGDQRQGSFIGRLTAAIASVQLLVLSGNLALLLFAWIFTSIALQRLLIFYHHRAAAIIASKKKFIMARMSDLFLAIGVFILYTTFHTADLAKIMEKVEMISATGMDLSLGFAAICFAIAAIFKSAQFPVHTWLIEVMETPTPVSALLHAGLLNAGPFLIIRFAWFFEWNTAASTLLMVIGGITALFGSWVYITQTSVKTSLAYSSIAHMGFSLMVCGMGAYAAAMLHLVAHSFYKAHSFLSSGSAVDQIRSSFPSEAKRNGSIGKTLLAITVSVATFLLISRITTLSIANEPALLFLSSVVVLGGSLLVVPHMNSSLKLILRSLGTVLVLMGAFLILEGLSSALLGNSVPHHNELTGIQYAVLGILSILFWTSLTLQLHSNKWLDDPRFKSIAIHLKNGLYINSYFDKWIGAHKIHKEVSRQSEQQVDERWIPDSVSNYRKQSA